MKAILQYTDLDDKHVFGVLSKNNVEIIKTKQKEFSIYPQITIRIKDIDTLNKILEQLNRESVYGIRLIRTKSEQTFCERIKRFLNKI